MPFPTSLYNSFNLGRDNLELSSSEMNPYAKWMQSPNIPKNCHLPIALENIEATKEQEPTVTQWFDQLESNDRKIHTKIPLFFPRIFHSHPYYSTIHKGETKWIEALLSSNDKMFSIYSDNSKQKLIRELIVTVTNSFLKVYNQNIFRCYKNKKSEIYASLFKNTTSAGLHIYSIILNKNIIIIREFGYEFCSIYDKFRDTICLWEHDGNVGNVLRTDSEIVDIQYLFRCKKDLFETRTKNIAIASNDIYLKKLRELNKKNINDLKKEAQDNGVNYNNAKSIKKQDIIDSIFEQFANSQ